MFLRLFFDFPFVALWFHLKLTLQTGLSPTRQSHPLHLVGFLFSGKDQRLAAFAAHREDETSTAKVTSLFAFQQWHVPQSFSETAEDVGGRLRIQSHKGRLFTSKGVDFSRAELHGLSFKPDGLVICVLFRN